MKNLEWPLTTEGSHPALDPLLAKGDSRSLTSSHSSDVDIGSVPRRPLSILIDNASAKVELIHHLTFLLPGYIQFLKQAPRQNGEWLDAISGSQELLREYFNITPRRIWQRMQSGVLSEEMEDWFLKMLVRLWEYIDELEFEALEERSVAFHERRIEMLGQTYTDIQEYLENSKLLRVQDKNTGGDYVPFRMVGEYSSGKTDADHEAALNGRETSTDYLSTTNGIGKNGSESSAHLEVTMMAQETHIPKLALSPPSPHKQHPFPSTVPNQQNPRSKLPLPAAAPPKSSVGESLHDPHGKSGDKGKYQVLRKLRSWT